MKILTFSFCLSLLFCVSWQPAQYEAFIECLEKYPQPSSSPISDVVYTPDNPSFSSVLQAYIRNLRFNESTTPKPRLIITASHVSHIQAAIVCGKAYDFQMRIRSGGHDYDGVSYVSDYPNFFILDMSKLRATNISIEEESAWVECGATLGELYYRIAERSNVHAFPAGVCPTVGVGGHFSAGGYGNMMRKYGLSVDNIDDAQLVDANGRLLDRKAMGEDLFWAITGGGGSSYGVVLSYKIKLRRVPSKLTVFRVHRTYDSDFTHLICRYQEVAPNSPDELFVRLTLDVVNSTIRATFRALYLGSSQDLLSLIESIFPELGMQQADCIEMSWAESVLFWYDFPTGTPVNALLSRVPTVLTYLKRKSDYLKKPVPRPGLEFMFKKMVELQFPMLAFNPYGGEMARIPPSAKPFPHRAGNLFKIQYVTNWNDGGVEVANYYLNLTRALYSYMTPFVSMKPRQAFLNYRDLDIGTNDQERDSFGLKYFKDNYDRLVRIKTMVDPQDFFRNEQSIPATIPKYYNLQVS
ncbi:reticuline oxidase-like protein [Dorcoceras hygrometricum]|uniref:Reticuline oxidase-like protein n=1 Tax=Dorcoceras hygrometricum TaxID=472368 RepID=A0A2Z7A6A7_9LAMI|nr:reticuline oxidase-like protein [Dorcoceras hygrometricum]